MERAWRALAAPHPRPASDSVLGTGRSPQTRGVGERHLSGTCSFHEKALAREQGSRVTCGRVKLIST